MSVRPEEASMRTLALSRLLAAGFTFALIATGVLSVPAAAADYTRWTDTVEVEDALVQACYGFNVTGSYTADRSFHVVENFDGSRFYERQDVTFAGVLGNAVIGKAYAYDGQFTRISKPNLGKVSVSNLSLRFEVDTPGEFSISLKRVEFDLGDDPHAIIKAIVPDLCHLFGGSTIGYGPTVPPSHSSADMSEGRLALPQWTDDAIERPASAGSDVTDALTPWTKLDPCDTSPPGKPC
jgi:hypothetical protein